MRRPIVPAARTAERVPAGAIRCGSTRVRNTYGQASAGLSAWIWSHLYLCTAISLLAAVVVWLFGEFNWVTVFVMAAGIFLMMAAEVVREPPPPLPGDEE